MFLAFNNGIAATAEEIELAKSEADDGLCITRVKDFQIVNGGQTTASIYHTLKKDKVDISGIFVQVKLSVVKNRDNFAEIVSRISEYANTQNKVSVSDLSSNRPYHIELEKLSRNIYTPHVVGQSNQQTKWFYERSRGQYKNARLKEGFTKARQRAFDLKNPKNQLFTKEDLAKYLNAYNEQQDGRKIVIGPHFVVRGNQKNYAQFVAFNIAKKVNNIYFEDLVSKAILFRTAEKLYGVKPNAIGDMRYITVPYSIAYFGYKTDCKLDLYKIWKNQKLSDELKVVLYNLMKEVELFIKSNAPGALYGEWAKKEECWNALKTREMGIDFNSIKSDLDDPRNPSQRKRIASEDSDQVQVEEEIEAIRAVPDQIWRRIEDWGRATGLLTEQQKTVAYILAGRIRSKMDTSDYERRSGMKIIEIVNKVAPELLADIDIIIDKKEQRNVEEVEITLDLVKKIVEWDRRNKRLDDYQFKFMADLATGSKTWSDYHRKLAIQNLKRVQRYGFKE
jgi:hypothetical protein